MAYELKTKKNNASISAFLNSIEDPKRRKDAKAMHKLMKELTGDKGKMWGASIVGYGEFEYKGRSSQGVWMRTGFSPRKGSLTLYIMPGFSNYKELMKKVGPHKTGKSCLYIKDLDDMHLPTLKKLIKAGYKDIGKGYDLSKK